MERSAGILLPIFSLPNRYGIGSLGKEARAFADFLHAAGQRWWQILPVGPVDSVNSPYASDSTFAGNPLFIDLEALAQRGYLTVAELESAVVADASRVDYGTLAATRDGLLRRAYARARDAEAAQVDAWANEHFWVKEYALFRAARLHYGTGWTNWPNETLRRHEWQAVQDARETLALPNSLYR